MTATDGWDTLSAIPEHLRSALRAELPRARELRRALHAAPRLSGDEEATTRAVLAELPAGATTERVCQTGAVARIGPAGSAVAVRAELDALPLTEQTGVPWASPVDAMHACGHDVHLAALVAVARAVERAGAPVPLLAVLQPREESYPSGAKDMVESGVLARYGAAAVIGAHVQPALPGGTVACVPGAVNAAADEFTITVTGTGGHAGYPHRNRDAVLALSQCVVSLQQLVSRDTDPLDSAVVAVSSLSAGHAPNVTPGQATARGVVRTLSERHREQLHHRLRAVVRGTAEAHGCSAAVDITGGEPVLRNHGGLAAATSSLLRKAGYAVAEEHRSCGSDDFSYYSQMLPSLMLFVGVSDAGAGSLHHPAFLPRDEAVDHVAEAMLAGFLAAGAAAPVSARFSEEG